MVKFRGFGSAIYRVSLAILLFLACLLTPPGPALAASSIVGTGTPDSCTQTAFDNSLNAVETSGGGTITFSCGTSQKAIIFSFQEPVNGNVDIDGGQRITLSGGNTTSLFQIYAGKTVTFKNITLARANNIIGAIENFGSLTINNCLIENNSTINSGGAILNHGDLFVTNSIIANNSAGLFGGGIYSAAGTVSVINSQLSNNSAFSGGGGIAVVFGVNLTITGSQFTGNSVTDTFAQGGAIRTAGTTEVIQATFSQNNGSRGGGMFIADGTSTISQSTFTGNWSAYGGGIRQEGGFLDITDTAFDGNGYAPSGSEVNTGGGALSWGAGSATLNKVAITNNWATYGGGIDHDAGTTDLTNVTFSGNKSVGSAAIDQGGGSITLTNVTIGRNSAPFFAGGIGNRSGTLSLKNTLLFSNINSSNNQSANCYKVITSNAFNMSSDSTCGFGQGYDNIDPLGGPLGYHGGPTQTIMLLKNSPAVDAGTGAGCPLTDQRGITRPQGQACDVGAVEDSAADGIFNLFLDVFLPAIQK